MLMQEIKTDELKKMIDNGEDFVLVDALGVDSYRKNHIPGAINIPLDELTRRKDSLPADRGKRIVTYCGSTTCSASEKIAGEIEKLGYSNVHRYTSGLKGWIEAGNSTEI